MMPKRYFKINKRDKVHCHVSTLYLHVYRLGRQTEKHAYISNYTCRRPRRHTHIIMDIKYKQTNTIHVPIHIQLYIHA